MKSILAPVVALSLAASSAFAQLMVNTPASAVVCQPLLISWSGGTPPYFLSVVPGGQTGAAALMTFPETNTTQVTWIVNIPQGTSLGLNLRDQTGQVAQSAPFSIQPGSDTSCVGSSSSIGSGSTAPPGASTTSQTSPATTGTPSTTRLTTPGTSASSPLSSAASGTSKATTGTSASASSPSSTKSAGASRVSGQVAAAGIIGAALIALLG